MSYGKRIAAALFGLVLGLAPSGLAHASTIGGLWTYNFDLGNGASFQVSFTAPFGQTGDFAGDSFTGTPAGFDGYVPDNVLFSGNNTYQHDGDGNNLPPDGGFDQEIVIQYDVADGDYSQTLDYTFVEPTSFWQNTGTTAFTTGGGEYIFAYLAWNGPVDVGANQVPGEVAEGANYATYINSPEVPSDPPCTSCTITTTFTPSIVSAVPEPSTFTLFGTGIAAALGVYRRRFRS